MGPAYRPRPGREEALAIARRPLPDVDAMLARLRLPKALAVVAGGMGGTSLDHGWFAFGRTYRVTRDLKGNRAGALCTRDRVRFLGAYVFPYDNGLRLHFEPVDQPGEAITLEFEGNFPEAEGVVRMINDANARTYFAPEFYEKDPTRRSELLEAEASLRTKGAETRALMDAVYEAAKPAYQRQLEALTADDPLLIGNAAYGYVMGDEGSRENYVDFGPLRYGHGYRVTRPVQANRSGSLTRGDVVIFRGAIMSYGAELTLDFIRDDRSLNDIVFYPSDPAEVPDLADLSSFLQEQPEVSSATSTKLITLRAILDDLRQQREAAE